MLHSHAANIYRLVYCKPAIAYYIQHLVYNVKNSCDQMQAIDSIIISKKKHKRYCEEDWRNVLEDMPFVHD